jgi:dCMP deaminase
MRTPDPWGEVFMGMAHVLARKSKDPSSQFGAVLVNADNRVLGVGYNGPPPQLFDAMVPWDQRPAKYAFIVHAEENAILDALDKNPAERLSGSTLYVTGYPCPGCVLRAIRAGVELIAFDRTGRVAACVDDAARETVSRLVSTVRPGRRFAIMPADVFHVGEGR